MLLMKLCPHCHRYVASQIFPMESGLGAPSYLCGGCGKPFLTSRREWAEMSGLRKAWYVTHSVVAAVLLAVFVGKVCELFHAVLTDYPVPVMVKLPKTASFWFPAILFFTAVLFVQRLRIRWSLRRTSGLDPWSPTTAFWSVQTNTQFLFFLTFTVLFLTTAAIGAIQQSCR